MSELCRVLIAEDEYITQQGIRHLVDWEQEGFEIVGTVSNGRDALRLVEELNPHIVLTDVVMPVMNGVELTGLLRAQFPSVQVVILSGYSDFEYVRGSFQGGAVDYILKSTLSPGGLLNIMRRASERIPGLELRRGTSSPESQLGQLLTGMQDGDIPAVLTEALPRPQLLMLGFPAGRMLHRQRDAVEVQGALLARCAADCLAAFPHLQVVADTDILLLVVSFFGSEETECMAAVKETAKRCADAEPAVFYIASEPVQGLAKLRQAYHGAFSKKLESFFYHRGTTFLRERDIRPAAAVPRLDGQRLGSLLGDSRWGDALTLLREYVASALEAKAPDELELKSMAQNALYQIVARLEDMGLDAANLAHLKRDCLAKIQACAYAESFQETTGQILEDLTAILDTYGLYAHNATMENILAHIDTYYADPITLQSIARQFNFSYTYLSSYFHTHNSEGFSEYLNRVRIRHAAELLREGRSVSEVCGAVGYGDQSYFTKVFKRYEGRTPSDYRRAAGGGARHG